MLNRVVKLPKSSVWLSLGLLAGALSACGPKLESVDPFNPLAGMPGPDGARATAPHPGAAPAAAPSADANSYDAALAKSGDACLAAWNWKQVRYAACLFQGGYVFLDLDGTDLNHPESVRILAKGRSGNVKATWTTPSVQAQSGGRVDFAFGSSLRLEGVDLRKNPPSLGYDVLGGNSGSCVPLVTGSPASCATAAAQNPYSDQIPASHFHVPAGAELRVDECALVKKPGDEGSAYSSIETLTVAATAPCRIAGRTLQPGSRVSFDLAEPANYPRFTTPRN